MPAVVVQSPAPAVAAYAIPTPAVQRLIPAPTSLIGSSLSSPLSSPSLLSAWTLASPTPAPGVTTVPVAARPAGQDVVEYGDVEAVALPTVRGLRLQKRQTVVQVVVVTVVTLIAAVGPLLFSLGMAPLMHVNRQTPQAQPTAVTLTVPSPQQTLISEGGWPIINPGSAAACWGDYACNSVCANCKGCSSNPQGPSTKKIDARRVL